MISEISEGAKIPVALYYNENTGFETAYDRVENDDIELRDDVTITRIDRKGKTPKDGSVGIGLTKVKQMNKSSTGKTHYLILKLLKFETHAVEESVEQNNHKVRSHVDRSHRDTATIRATSGLQKTNITR